jgi:hypothetical protein
MQFNGGIQFATNSNAIRRNQSLPQAPTYYKN